MISRTLRRRSLLLRTFRSLVGLVAVFALLGGRCQPGPPAPPLDPAPGLPEYQEFALAAVPGGAVNVAGGSLRVSRHELDLDTRLGNLPIRAVYDSAAESWRWSFELVYDGASFTDESGATYGTGSLAPEEGVPGTHWVKIDASRLATRGGLVHVFAAGRLSAIHWRGADYPRFVFLDAEIAGAPRLVEIRQYLDAQTWEPLFTLNRDAVGRLVGIDDRAGRSAAFTWNAQGRLGSARDGLDLEQGWPGFRYEYAGGRLTAVTNSEGERVEYEYASGRLTRARAVAGESATFELEYAGRGPGGLYATVVRDPLGGEWRWRYDGTRRVRELEGPTGDTTAFTWSGLHTSSRTDPAGVTIQWAWQDGDLVQEVQPSGNVLSLSWHPTAPNRENPRQRALVQAQDSLGVLETRSYDAQGRLASVVDAVGDTRTFAWGPLGELLSATAPNGQVTSYSGYGEHGHATLVTTGEGDHPRSFDAVGNLVGGDSLAGETSPARPGIVSRTFDADRNVATVLLADLQGGFPVNAETLTVEYRSDGRRRRILRPHGGDTEFVYDGSGWLVERRERADGLWHVTRFERDALGRATRIERPNDTWSELAWDSAGRRSSVASGRGAIEEAHATFGWAAGRMVSIQDSAHAGPELLSYDTAGRVQTVLYPDGELLQLGRDLRSRTTDEVYWHAGTLLRHLRYSYDGEGRLVEARDGVDLLVSRTYVEGRWEEIAYGNGLVRTASYAPDDGLLAGTTTVDGAGNLVETTSFVRSHTAGILAARQWTTVTTTAGGLAATSEESHLLTPFAGTSFDAGPRPSQWDSDPQTLFETYHYDALGNLVQRLQTKFVHNPERNRLLRVEDLGGGFLHDYVWDEAGFATERDGVALDWTGAGRIASIEGVASFGWDAIGRPTSIEVGGVLRSFLFGGRVAADALGNPVSIERREVRIDLVAGAHRWRHFDFRGNVKFVSDAQGNVIAHRRLDAYGTHTLWGVDPDGLGFAQGRELGELVLLGGRVYDPEAGRFLAPDPVYQLVNAYAYSQGNPIWFWDPSGRSLQSALTIAAGVGIAGMAVGAITAGAVAATPAVALVGLSIALFSAGFTVGVATPATATGPAAAAGLSFLGGGLAGFAGAAFPAGFVAGQTVANGLATDLGAGPPSPGLTGGTSSSGSRGDSPGGDGSTGDEFQGFQIKIVELTAEMPSGPTEGPGCSPILGTQGARGLGWMAAILVPLQLLLGWRSLRRCG